MSLEHRVSKLEVEAKSKIVDLKSVLLFDSNSVRVDAEMVRMPTPDLEGLARLPDGSEMPILFEVNWQDIMFVMPKDEETSDGKLRVRRGDVRQFIVDYGDP